MGVYVDDMSMPYRQQSYCHLFADRHEELMVMAARLALPPSALQAAGTAREHFVLSATMQKMALEHGARSISCKQMDRRVEAKWKAAQSSTGRAGNHGEG